MLTRFYFIVLVVVGLGVLWIEYGREKAPSEVAETQGQETQADAADEPASAGPDPLPATEDIHVVENDAALSADHLVTSGSFSIVVASGEWTQKNYSTTGTWRVVQEEGQRYVELDAAFATQSGPDLKLFLSPTGLDDLTDQNATDASVFIGLLENNEGAQRFAIPDDVSLAEFDSLIIHCEQFSKLWSGASLN